MPTHTSSIFNFYIYIYISLSICNGCMPVRAVCKPHSPDLKKRHSSGCSLWRSLLERPPPAPESRVRDPLGARTSCGGVDPGGGVTYRYIFRSFSLKFTWDLKRILFAQKRNVSLLFWVHTNKRRVFTDSKDVLGYFYLYDQKWRRF